MHVCVGDLVGPGVGFGVVGDAEGLAVGLAVGTAVGNAVGVAVGFAVGAAVGFGVGLEVGPGVVGATVVGFSDEKPQLKLYRPSLHVPKPSEPVEHVQLQMLKLQPGGQTLPVYEPLVPEQPWLVHAPPGGTLQPSADG